MNIDGSVYCDVDRSVGNEVWRENYFRVDSYVDSAVGIGYGEWFELEVGYQFGSRDDLSVNKGVNVSKAESVWGSVAVQAEMFV